MGPLTPPLLDTDTDNCFSLRRRFEQNQEDCTFTVLALLPTVTTNILEAMNTEAITYQIQHMKTGAAPSGAAARSPPSIADTLVTEDESRSMISMQSESGVHASQVVLPAQAPTSNPTTTTTTTTATTAGEVSEESPAKLRKTKRQLWDELTISCELCFCSFVASLRPFVNFCPP